MIQRRSVTPPILIFSTLLTALLVPPAECDYRRPSGLQLLNNKFVSRQAIIFADRVIDEVGADQTAEVRRLSLCDQPAAAPCRTQADTRFPEASNGFPRTRTGRCSSKEWTQPRY